VPSLDDWEKSFRTGTNALAVRKPAVVPVDFRAGETGNETAGIKTPMDAEARVG